MAGVSRGAQLDGAGGQVPANTLQAAVNQLVHANETGDLPSAADANGPLGHSAAALHDTVLQWVTGRRRAGLPADVVERFRRSQEQMNRLNIEVEGLSDRQLRARLAAADVTSVNDPSWIQTATTSTPAARLRRLFVDSRVQELSDPLAQSAPNPNSVRAEVDSMARHLGIPQLFEDLVDHGVPVPLDFLDSAGLRAGVRESEVRRPLSDEEYGQLLTTLRSWQPDTDNWSTAYGEMFPGLVAHALGVRLVIRRPGPDDTVGPVSRQTVVVAYDGDSHYDAVIDTTAIGRHPT
jgi:hypothetical protein